MSLPIRHDATTSTFPVFAGKPRIFAFSKINQVLSRQEFLLCCFYLLFLLGIISPSGRRDGIAGNGMLKGVFKTHWDSRIGS